MARVLAAAWLALLLWPVVTASALANAWEAPRWQLLLVGGWFALAAWLLLPRRAFLVLTYPLVLAGLVVAVADAWLSVNLFELLAVSFTFREGEVLHALRPHLVTMALAAALLLAMLVALWRAPPASRPRPAARAAVALMGLLLALTLPAASWRNAWPGALAMSALQGNAGDGGIALPGLPNTRNSPRNRFETWDAHRERSSDEPETYVLVIGESVRSDRVPGCGGRPQVTAPPADALLYCDVLSGSSSTHTSVPLLVSRDVPGGRERITHDATMLKAFEAVGFETFWFGLQERAIAWPDAANQAYEPAPRLDREALLPWLEQALAKPSRRKLIVLHAYNAHAPYHARYRPERAPFAVDPRVLDGAPSREALPAWWNDYDNAIDESLRFVNEVIARLQARPGTAFLVFTPDHAENMLDDARGLTLHALKVPTLWDTRVPGIVWANAAWRTEHVAQWQMLAANRGAGLMHMDFAPTLLGAAGIRYREPRAQVVDLTARAVPARVRFTHLRAGETITLEQLREQAR